MRQTCTTCGAPIGRAVRFCSACGAPTAGDAAPATLNGSGLTDHTARDLDAVTAGPVPPERAGDAAAETVPNPVLGAPARWWARVRNRSLVAVIACGILLGVAVGLAFADGGSIGPSAPAARATRPTRPSSKPPRAVTAAPRRVGSRSRVAFVTAVETILQQSATGHAALVAAVASVRAGCPAGSVASKEIAGVVNNRATVLRELNSLSVASNAESETLRDTLVQALQASAAADAHYEAWAASLETTTPACDTSSDPAGDYAAAQQADVTATAYKSEFVTGFNPLAGRAGLATWAPSDF